MGESVYTPDPPHLICQLPTFVRQSHFFLRHRRHSGAEARMFGKLVPDSRTPVIPIFRNRAAKKLTGK